MSSYVPIINVRDRWMSKNQTRENHYPLDTAKLFQHVHFPCLPNGKFVNMSNWDVSLPPTSSTAEGWGRMLQTGPASHCSPTIRTDKNLVQTIGKSCHSPSNPSSFDLVCLGTNAQGQLFNDAFLLFIWGQKHGPLGVIFWAKLYLLTILITVSEMSFDAHRNCTQILKLKHSPDLSFICSTEMSVVKC